MNSILKIQVVNPTGETLLSTTKNRYASLDDMIQFLAVKVKDPLVIRLSITSTDTGFDFVYTVDHSSPAACRTLIYGDAYATERQII
jgi:hypothetical protein